jgi:hypothetical protein
VELQKKPHDLPLRSHFRQSVRAVLDETPRSLGSGQAIGCCGKRC